MKTILITGANRGIGLQLAAQCAARGEQVIAVVRKTSPELDALGVRVEAGVDLTADDLSGLPGRLAGVEIDVLINNAGLLERHSLGEIDYDALRRQFEINSVAPLRLSEALLPNLSAGGRIGLITSRMGSITDNTSGAYYGYRMSKAALNIAGVSLAHDLKPKGIAVAIIHPGYVRTDMTGNQGFIDANESAANILARMDALTLETSGTFWHANGDLLPW